MTERMWGQCARCGGALTNGHVCRSWETPRSMNTFSSPVMNPPADEAEARNRANTAPSQSDSHDAGRVEIGPSCEPEARPVLPTAQFQWQPGVITFHTPRNKALIEDFYASVKDLREAACIVDLWLMDIHSVLNKHGYEMTITRLSND